MPSNACALRFGVCFRFICKWFSEFYGSINSLQLNAVLCHGSTWYLFVMLLLLQLMDLYESSVVYHRLVTAEMRLWEMRTASAPSGDFRFFRISQSNYCSCTFYSIFACKSFNIDWRLKTDQIVCRTSSHAYFLFFLIPSLSALDVPKTNRADREELTFINK